VLSSSILNERYGDGKGKTTNGLHETADASF
jgi:hypothetical protein